MDQINWRFSDRFGSHWIKVKFYKEKPTLEEAQKLKRVRFCEATREAIKYPVLLDKNSISCPGAQYAFGWNSNYKNELLGNCQDKRQTQVRILKSMFSKTPYFKRPFKYIGLNTEGEPDLIMSYMSPEQIMNLIKIYNNLSGENLDVSLSSMMPVCSGIAVKTYLKGEVSLSFGCDDSRKFSDMRRDSLVIGISKNLFKVFVD